MNMQTNTIEAHIFLPKLPHRVVEQKKREMQILCIRQTWHLRRLGSVGSDVGYFVSIEK